MCNDYGNRIPYSAYLEAFSHLKIQLGSPGGPPNGAFRLAARRDRP